MNALKRAECTAQTHAQTHACLLKYSQPTGVHALLQACHPHLSAPVAWCSYNSGVTLATIATMLALMAMTTRLKAVCERFAHGALRLVVDKIQLHSCDT